MSSVGLIIALAIGGFLLIAVIGVITYFATRKSGGGTTPLIPINPGPSPPLVPSPVFGNIYSIQSVANPEYYWNAYINTTNQNNSCTFASDPNLTNLNCSDTAWVYTPNGIKTSSRDLFIGESGPDICPAVTQETTRLGMPLAISASVTPLAWEYDTARKTLCLPPNKQGNPCPSNQPDNFYCIRVISDGDTKQAFVTTNAICTRNLQNVEPSALLPFQWNFTEPLSSTTVPSCIDTN